MEASKIRLLCEMAKNLSPLLTEIEFLEICKIYNAALDREIQRRKDAGEWEE